MEVLWVDLPRLQQQHLVVLVQMGLQAKVVEAFVVSDGPTSVLQKGIRSWKMVRSFVVYVQLFMDLRCVPVAAVPQKRSRR